MTKKEKFFRFGYMASVIFLIVAAILIAVTFKQYLWVILLVIGICICMILSITFDFIHFLQKEREKREESKVKELIT